MVSVRTANGIWRTLYRTCWQCGYDELQRLRKWELDPTACYRYDWMEVS